jgi:hypothetical protein
MMINEWKKTNKFVQIKFHLNENIKWYYMQLELDSIWI